MIRNLTVDYYNKCTKLYQKIKKILMIIRYQKKFKIEKVAQKKVVAKLNKAKEKVR